MTAARSAKQVTAAIRKAGFAAECFKGEGYVYFMSDDGREVSSVYVCYLNQLSVEQYVDHVGSFFNEME